MKHGTSFGLLLAVLALGPHDAAGQEPRRFEGQLRLEGLFYGNFFWAPEGEPQENVVAASLEGRLLSRLGRSRQLEAFFHLGQLSYDDFDASRKLTAGVRKEGHPHAFELALEQQWNRPSVDVGDVFDTADVFHLGGEYAYRIDRDWQAKAVLDYRHESYELASTHDSDIVSAGPFVRYRGFGPRFSPEVGVTFGSRDTVDDSEDHSQRELFLMIRSAPRSSRGSDSVLARTYVSARYRYRRRDYSIADPDASNFGRQDRRHQLSLVADIPGPRRLSFIVYYAFEDANSSRPDRQFTTQILSLGLTARF